MVHVTLGVNSVRVCVLCTEPDRVPHVAGDVPGAGHAVQGQDADAA